jgi:alcohol dehydrogenase class IV
LNQARHLFTLDTVNSFIYNSQPARVVFGAGALAHLEREIEALGAKKALVLSTPEQRASAERIAELLGSRAAGIFDRAVMHVPIETARDAREVARELGADCAVAIGGGSTTGLGKAIALDSGLPILAIPTTYAGSEMTPIYGITEGGLKKTGKDARVLPRTVIYDPELTLGLPVAMSVTSGINAIAHAAEGLYAVDTNPIMDLMAQEGIAAIGRALPAIAKNPRDIEARSDALYGAWMCGTVLGNVGMALHHKLCHTLGGSFNLPHAETHTIVLPHALAYNAAAAPQAMARIAKSLEGKSAAQAVYDLAKDNGAPVALKDIGMKEADLDRACEIAMQNQYPNPRPLERNAIRQLLQDAFEGARPTA